MRVRSISKRLSGDPLSDEARLARLIQKLKPDVIHSMTESGCSLTLAARKILKDDFPPWIHSSWGSDICYFGRLPEYAERIREGLSVCDFLMADCQRELDLAPEFGFQGELLGVFPAAGGFDIAHMQGLSERVETSKRKLIMLKGRQAHLGGRAIYALQALHLCAELLRDYEIVIYIANDVIKYGAEYVTHLTGLRFRILPEHTSHDEMVELMGKARIAIGVGMTDGTPHAMLEAMVMGAFPIQSNTADVRGWVEDGRNAIMIPPEDAEAIVAAIKKALSDDQMVDEAAVFNSQITKEKIDIGIVKPKAIEAYRLAKQGREKNGRKS
jgi:glycosyltransferase involved in cell wall biosynthesis